MKSGNDVIVYDTNVTVYDNFIMLYYNLERAKCLCARAKGDPSFLSD